MLPWLPWGVHNSHHNSGKFPHMQHQVLQLPEHSLCPSASLFAGRRQTGSVLLLSYPWYIKIRFPLARAAYVHWQKACPRSFFSDKSAIFRRTGSHPHETGYSDFFSWSMLLPRQPAQLLPSRCWSASSTLKWYLPVLQPLILLRRSVHSHPPEEWLLQIPVPLKNRPRMRPTHVQLPLW